MEASILSEMPAFGRLNKRLIATIRLILSSAVLCIISSSELDDLGLFDLLVVLYIIYSAVLYLLADRPIHTAFFKRWLLADVIWAAALTMSSDDASTAFLFLFPTLIAAFEWSFTAALRLTLLIAQFLLVIGFVKAHFDPSMQLSEVLLPPIYLIAFGYLALQWGDRERAAKRRLLLLKEITRLSNPRFGIDRTIGTMMERLRVFYDAEACLMIVTNISRGEHLLRRADRRDPEHANTPEKIRVETAQLLLAPPPDQSMIYLGPQQGSMLVFPPHPTYFLFHDRDSRRVVTPAPPDEALITLLEAESFISVPVQDSDDTTGRLYLTAARRRAFSEADVTFLLQVMEQVIPLIENIRLVDQLASNAANAERRRLARDIHDSVIQPYIGFKLGLAAVSEKINAGHNDIANDIERLKLITDQGIDNLRHYVHQLPQTPERQSVLLDSVRRFATTFSETTHIAVQIDVESDLAINDRLAAEIFQMIVEGLTNIKRHTQALHANIKLACQNNVLVLCIINDHATSNAFVRFLPRSITERAAALGGQVRVEHIFDDNTQVAIEIPL